MSALLRRVGAALRRNPLIAHAPRAHSVTMWGEDGLWRAGR